MKLDMTGQCTPADLDFIHCVDSCEIERIGDCPYHPSGIYAEQIQSN